jgi:hypothetical protein
LEDDPPPEAVCSVALAPVGAFAAPFEVDVAAAGCAAALFELVLAFAAGGDCVCGDEFRASASS